jgi:uncharacterized protein
MSDYERLVADIKDMEGVVVGYSGGVDSTLVAKAATDALGERALCVLIDSCLIPRSEIDEAVALAGALGFNLKRIKTDAMAIDQVPDNNPDRCYHCKLAVFSMMVETAKKESLQFVLDGTNADDESDFRPGAKATKELAIRSPLKDLGFGKEKIREISHELELPTWDKPSYACLASRVPYGHALTREVLGQIEAAESILHELGFRQCRVRHHGGGRCAQKRHQERRQHDQADHAHVERLDLFTQVFRCAAHHQPRDEHGQNDERQHPVNAASDAAEDYFPDMHEEHQHHAAQRRVTVQHRIDGTI